MDLNCLGWMEDIDLFAWHILMISSKTPRELIMSLSPRYAGVLSRLVLAILPSLLRSSYYQF